MGIVTNSMDYLLYLATSLQEKTKEKNLPKLKGVFNNSIGAFSLTSACAAGPPVEKELAIQS